MDLKKENTLAAILKNDTGKDWEVTPFSAELKTLPGGVERVSTFEIGAGENNRYFGTLKATGFGGGSCALRLTVVNEKEDETEVFRNDEMNFNAGTPLTQNTPSNETPTAVVENCIFSRLTVGGIKYGWILFEGFKCTPKKSEPVTKKPNK